MKGIGQMVFVKDMVYFIMQMGLNTKVIGNKIKSKAMLFIQIKMVRFLI